MFLDFMLKKFRENRDRQAIVWKEKPYDYAWLLKRMRQWQRTIESRGIEPGTVTVLETDFTPSSVALFLALVEKACILIPLSGSVEAKKKEFIDIAQGEVQFSIDRDDQEKITELPSSADHQLYGQLRRRQHPGLVLFSSGSTGKSKAIVHDFSKLLEKFKKPRKSMRTIPFLLFDHIGGINTLFYTLSNTGCIVSVQDRSPVSVCRAIGKHKVELLPTSPTFINLLILSEAFQRYDISSLKTITYGTEPMPQSTLKRIHQLLPNVRLQQTYGLSELGILRSKSRDSGSLSFKIGGEGFQTRIVNGTLWIRADSAMLGYLNALDPFDENGWFNTGDAVEVDGDYIRILGRESEIINVGGEKVYPVEVEGVLQQIEGVEDVTINGEPNPITGQIVKAQVKLNSDETIEEFRKRMRRFCRDKLPNYKIPQKVVFTDKEMYGERFKKVRRE